MEESYYWVGLDNGRIVVINAANDNYAWYEFAHKAIKTCKRRDKQKEMNLYEF